MNYPGNKLTHPSMVKKFLGSFFVYDFFMAAKAGTGTRV
jgi:hypothetical protein